MLLKFFDNFLFREVIVELNLEGIWVLHLQILLYES